MHVDEIRAVDHDLVPGVQPDMREHGFDTDDWPEIYRAVKAADILVIGTPIWLGDKSSAVHSGDRTALLELGRAE